jgi:hypothetical protein
MSTNAQVQNWIAQAPQGISRWPGIAVRDSKDNVVFRRGTVSAVTDLSISIEPEPGTFLTEYVKSTGKHLVKLMGEAYAHYCENCKHTIPGNVTYRRSPGSVMHRGFEIPIRFFCPYCGPDHPLRTLRSGEKVRIHYRFTADRTSGGWFGEVFEW